MDINAICAGFFGCGWPSLDVIFFGLAALFAATALGVAHYYGRTDDDAAEAEDELEKDAITIKR